jgi:hypothetical protein
MNHRPEPDDVDLFVGGVEPDPQASRETAEFIEEYKKRPDFPREAEEARRLLAAIGINPETYGMPDAQALLEHWHRCVAKLHAADHRATNGTERDEADIEPATGSSRKNPD